MTLRVTAQKEFDDLDHLHRTRVAAALVKLREQPVGKGRKKLTGCDEMYRIRVGDYRIIYEIRFSLRRILVLRIVHRSIAYRHLN